MAGVALELQVDSELAIAGLDRLTTSQMAMIADEVGGLIAQQTKDRIEDEKASPEGAPWAPWSARYAASLVRPNRTSARSLLIASENLVGSIQQYAAGLTSKIGTNVPYGAIHQFGGRGIPARPYLGLSGENRADIEALVIDRLEDLIQ